MLTPRLITFYFGLILSVLLTACSSIGLAKKTERLPNIIFIMADDLGYGDLGCYGQKIIQTPHIDQLAKEGMRFTDCYAGSPVCAPARSVLMTGQHSGHTTVRANHGRSGRVPLNKDDVTVAEVLKTAGYVTGMTGKWGLGEPGTVGVPNDPFSKVVKTRTNESFLAEPG